jgi:hypothetical protein
LAATGFDVLANAIGPLGVYVVDGHRCTFFGHALGNAFTNAVASACDQNGLTLDSHAAPLQ